MPETCAPFRCFNAPEAFLPHRRKIESVWQKLIDKESRVELERQLRFRLLLDYGDMNRYTAPIYFDPAVLPPPENDCIYVDCGAYNGDTLKLFLGWARGRFKSAIALEPDPINYARLLQVANEQPAAVRDRIICLEAAAGATSGTAHFSDLGDESSAIAADGTIAVKLQALDEVLKEEGAYFIKFDVEGGEPDALRGLARTIREKAPVLAVSVYHRYDDLWAIPLYLLSLRPDYRFYLRAYSEEGMDTVLYALPNAAKLSGSPSA
jgi:FkbM family methyltransferase